MTFVGLLLLMLVGAVCGAVAQAIVGFNVGGLLASIGVGFLGALFGTWLAHGIGLPSLFAVRIEGYTVEIFWSILGAILLLLALSVVRRRRAYDGPGL
jgi:uncharacterized membrane protein YeaQ/YmgE (transglycosylase-associated protein family)